MSGTITSISICIMSLAESRIDLFKNSSNAQLLDLIHECNDLSNHNDCSIRMSAEINKATAMLVLEQRGIKS